MLMLTLLCAAALCGMQQDPVRVTAGLSAERIDVGATTTLQITVETRGAVPDDIRIPDLPRALDMIGTSEYTQTQISIPGGRTRATRREVVLLARAPGVYRIEEVIIVVDGRTYRTSPLDLVVRAGSGAADPTSATTSASSLEVRLQPDTVYVGQQVLLRAQVTFSEEMRLRQSRPPTFDPPAPSGFWIQDVPDPVSVSLRVREGRTVETQTYRRAYFPLSPGEFRFPPARLHYEVRRGFLYSPESRQLVSDSARLVVLPLPEAGRPATFTGAVGRLVMRASLAPERVAVGEPTVLTVEIEGLGNVKALPEPRLADVPNADVFSPTQESRVDVADDRVGGIKRFQWMIVPQQPGQLRIPPVEYGVFDPELRSYVVLRSDTLHVDATVVVAESGSDAALRGLRTTPGGNRLDMVRTPAFAVLQLAPVLLLFGAVQLRRRRSRPPSPRDYARQARRELAALGADGPGVMDLAQVERTLCEGVLRITAARHADPVRALRESGRVALAARLDALLHELQRARYAPGASFDGSQLLARADGLLKDIVPVRRWGRRSGGAAALLIGLPVAGVLVLPVVGAQPSLRAEGDEFGRGIAAYDAGDFDAAAGYFRDYASAQPRDPSGWYNVGTAAFRAGDRGSAVWAWLRAARLAPRDEDIRHNLRVAGAAPAVDRVVAPDRLSTEERALAAAVGWWLLVAGFGAALFGLRGLAWSAAPGVTLLLAAAVVAGFMAAAPRLVAPLQDGVPLYAGPTTREVAIGLLEPGTLAAVVEQRDEWLRVRTGGTAAGREAWVESTAVATP